MYRVGSGSITDGTGNNQKAIIDFGHITNPATTKIDPEKAGGIFRVVKFQLQNGHIVIAKNRSAKASINPVIDNSDTLDIYTIFFTGNPAKSF